jgi:hypothetical protein
METTEDFDVGQRPTPSLSNIFLVCRCCLDFLTAGGAHRTGMTDTATVAAARKRSRSTGDDAMMFTNLRDWIRGDTDGLVHEAIGWQADTRELTVGNSLAPQTALLTIPADRVLSTATVIRQSNPDWIHLPPPPPKELHHLQDDCRVALYLATKPAAYEPYLASLELDQIVNALPRRWMDRQLAYLMGSPLLQRIAEQKQGVTKDHQAWQAALTGSSSWTKETPFPSLEAFDQALAVVSSRAFAGPDDGGTVSSCVLIPLLDLCNHQRGNQQENKNMSYAWSPGQPDGSSMVVRTVQTIAPNETLRITYGAQSNGHLLLNYGFSLSDNNEPDGSSNNVYEFHIDGTPGSDPNVIRLRLGPKSYTYGPLVQVLEALGPRDEQTSGNMGFDEEGDFGPDDDMDAFLNECEEEDGDDPGMGMYGDGLDGDNDDDSDGDVETQKQFDRKALLAFRDQLDALLQAYVMKEVSPEEAATPAYQYAKMLVASEKEILYFYRKAVVALLGRLGVKELEASAGDLPVSRMEHVNDLVEAFFQIRYTVL